MFWIYCLLVAYGNAGKGADEATDWMKPAHWKGNFWGPAATRARETGALPALPTNPVMTQWRRWGRNMLHEGDIVFRLGDARAMGGVFPLSRMIAKASGSPFSHTGIIAIEEGAPVVYDCSSDGVQRQPFEVWMLDCVGPMGVKRLKAEFRQRVPGVIGFCRAKFEQQVPFDYEFRLDDSALYCVELTEKAFRSQGLVLSEPVRIGDWDHLSDYPLTALAAPYVTSRMLEHPLTLDQPVYLPGNDHIGIWASSLLEAVYGPDPKPKQDEAQSPNNRPSLRGDIEMALFAVGEFRRLIADRPTPHDEPEGQVAERKAVDQPIRAAAR